MSWPFERRKEPRDTLRAKLRWLQRLGAPIAVSDLMEGSTKDYVLLLRTDLRGYAEAEVELKDVPALDWYDEWQIIGCLVSLLIEREEYTLRDELLESSKRGLAAVLDARIQQIENDGLQA